MANNFTQLQGDPRTLICNLSSLTGKINRDVIQITITFISVRMMFKAQSKTNVRVQKQLIY